MIKTDKIKHFIVSFVMVLVLNAFIGPLYAITATFVVGVAKETLDHFTPCNKFDVYDLFADVLGILIASLIMG